MARNPYEVLELNDGASLDEVRSAYRRLAMKYQSGEFTGNSESVNQKKMDEINEAYDTIISSLTSSQSNKGNYEHYTDYSQSSSFSDVRRLLEQNRLEEAETILDGVYMSARDAEWYFLKGEIHNRRGWFDEAYKAYSKACTLDGNNPEYKAAFDSLKRGAAGGYKTGRQSDSSCCCCPCDGSCCDICSSLVCADCCCESMGGDLIKCI
jgi:curved DNA-binding protein CbpA